jgi:hypothetical protein
MIIKRIQIQYNGQPNLWPLRRGYGCGRAGGAWGGGGRGGASSLGCAVLWISKSDGISNQNRQESINISRYSLAGVAERGRGSTLSGLDAVPILNMGLGVVDAEAGRAGLDGDAPADQSARTMSDARTACEGDHSHLRGQPHARSRRPRFAAVTQQARSVPVQRNQTELSYHDSHRRTHIPHSSSASMRASRSDMVQSGPRGKRRRCATSPHLRRLAQTRLTKATKAQSPNQPRPRSQDGCPRPGRQDP